MVAVTFRASHAPAVEAAPKAGRAETAQSAAPRKSWFARFYDAMIEARMAQANREIRMHTSLLPFTRVRKSDSENTPFGGL